MHEQAGAAVIAVREGNPMTARFLALYETPPDPETLDRHCRQVHIPLLRRLPGLRRYTGGRDIEGLHEAPNYLITELEWDTVDELLAASASPEGRATAADAARLQELAPVHRMIFTVEEASCGHTLPLRRLGQCAVACSETDRIHRGGGGAAEMGAGLAAAAGVLRPTASASTGSNTTATLVRTEITPLRAMKGQSRAVTAQLARGSISHLAQAEQRPGRPADSGRTRPNQVTTESPLRCAGHDHQGGSP